MSAAATPPAPRLSGEDLTLRRGGRVLFSGLSFAVEAGGALLLRGPNGAGKTSLLLAIAGVLRPETGRIDYSGGGDGGLAPDAHLLLPQPGLKPRLSVIENLAFWRAVNGPDGIDAESALARVGLGGLEPIEAGHLSTGQLRRLALARLIVSRRRLWLLDEPTSGLDTEGEALVAALLAEHCAAGGLAVVATHHDIAPSPGYRLETVRIGMAVAA